MVVDWNGKSHSDLRQFCEILSNFDEMTVGEFGKAIVDRPRVLPQQQRGSSGVDEEVVLAILSRLRDKADNFVDFNTELNKINADKNNISNQNLFEVAKCFTGASKKATSRPKAIQAIRDQQTINARTIRKIPLAGDVF